LAHYSQSSQVSTFSRSEVESGMGVGSLVRVEVGAGIVLHELLGHLPGQALEAGSGHRVGDPAVGDRNLEMLRERESGRPLASGSEQAKAPRQGQGKRAAVAAGEPPAPGGSLPVVETFHSLQGEGLHAGRSAFFIRLAGCSVGCS
jgi:hypothetical protein